MQNSKTNLDVGALPDHRLRGDEGVIELEAIQVTDEELSDFLTGLMTNLRDTPDEDFDEPSIEDDITAGLSLWAESIRTDSYDVPDTFVDVNDGDAVPLGKGVLSNNRTPTCAPSIGLPTEAAARKAVPVATGVVDYFPDALVAVAELSRVGNDQHNPGKPLHWDRSKSGDESDALMRHFIDRGTIDTDGVRHSAKVAWRALAMLQKELEDATK